MSILSFNHFDFSLMLNKVEDEKKQERMHKSKFWIQFIYNIIIFATYLGYAICKNNSCIASFLAAKKHL